MTTNDAIKERPVSVLFDDDMLHVTLEDGRQISTPLAWYPSLQNATDIERNDIELGVTGIHWRLLDEDLSVAGMLRGVRPMERRHRTS